MMTEEPKPLPRDLYMPCYSCEERRATHVCRYKIGELAVQVCLCAECMKIDTMRLLKKTIGLRGITAPPPAEDFLESASGLTSRPQPA
jgi:hypothetical protein